MASRWQAGGKQVASSWQAAGNQLAIRWQSVGNQVAIRLQSADNQRLRVRGRAPPEDRLRPRCSTGHPIPASSRRVTWAGEARDSRVTPSAPVARRCASARSSPSRSGNEGGAKAVRAQCRGAASLARWAACSRSSFVGGHRPLRLGRRALPLWPSRHVRPSTRCTVAH